MHLPRRWVDPMVNVVGSSDDYGRWKPEKFKDYLTRQEVATLCGRTRERIWQLERDGIISAPIRVRVGRLHVRLYSPSEVTAIVRHFQTAKPGRPKGGRR